MICSLHCSLNQDADYHASLIRISELLDTSCDTYCVNRIKDRQGCVVFCEFLDHVKKHDIESIYEKYVEANKKDSALVSQRE